MNKYLSPQKQQLNQLMEIECIPVEADYSIVNYENFSLDTLATTGLNLSSIIPAIKEAKALKQTSGTLYRMIPPKGMITGTLQSKNGITLGHFTNKKGIITNRASFEAVGKTAATVNPYALLIMAAVTIVTKKLDTIKENQLEIIEYLKLQEESRIKGNIKTLQDISEQLKYNLNNEQFRNNKLILIQDIKKEAEASIINSKSLVASKASKTTFFHFDKNIQDKKDQMEKIMSNYQLALYQFSYSSFLEVMLYENYDKSYLDYAYNKVIGYIDDYKKIQTDCYERLTKDSNTSIESVAIKGFAGMTKGIGKAIQKISLSTSGKDETELLEFSDKVKDYNNQRIESKLNSFIQSQEACSSVFANNIKVVNNLFNNELEILFDDETLYISITQSE